MSGYDNKYVKVTDKDGERYLCPVETLTDPSRIEGNIPDDCLEQDVAGRYAGNIEVVDEIL